MHETPSIKRRLITMVYETFLLLAVEMLAVALFLVVTLNNHAPFFQYAMKVWLFVVTGAYFVWGWTNSGHTLAMKTWRMQVVTTGGARLPLTTAIVRYLLAWGWFLPALLACTALGLKDRTQIGATIAVGVLAWGLTAFLDRDRQFLHDRLAGTRLVLLPKPAKAGAPAAPAEAS
ncbi:RDD family protein [Telluria mixta]|uniref:RDD family protein n=1 Tax=Telluria mixta TaxID=34071 RepID=A0ABT2BTQ7_9BURK|nr:RDD family protein [Telluria mixta]MCS0628503.1 RDD family protein [Telluria mixta]WEM93391.1 RDD family protein [Telluria mixta]